MKKIVLITILVFLLSTFALPAKGRSIVITMQVGKVRAMVNDEEVKLDVPSIIDLRSNRTLVPLRFVAEAFGAEVDWISKDKEIDIVFQDKKIVLFIGKKSAFINDIKVELDVAPIILFSRTLVPVRFVAETFGADVNWNGENKEITITLNTDNYTPEKKEYLKADWNAVSLAKKTVTINSGELEDITFYIVKINLKSENIHFTPFVSKNGPNSRESYDSFIKRVKPIAMVNGGTFDLTHNVPTGDVVRDGIPIFIKRDGYTEAIGVTKENTPFFVDGVADYYVDLDGKGYPIPGVNTENSELFTNWYKKGVSVGKDKVLFVVENKHPVLEKTGCMFYPAVLKDNQYALLLNKYTSENKPQEINLRIEINGKDFSGASFVKCGPLLLKNGKAYIDYLRYSDLNRTMKKGPRALLGFDNQNNLYFIFTPDPVCLNYGILSMALERLNMFSYVTSLDGGGSSLLYYKGNYIVHPGREIISVLAIPSEVEK